MEDIVRSYKRGRSWLFIRKITACLVFTVILFISVFKINFYNLNRLYGFLYLNAPVQSLTDIECIGDKVLLIKKGEIIAEGTPIELIEKMNGKVAEITCTLNDVEILQEKYKIGDIKQKKNGLSLRLVGIELPDEAIKVDSNIDLEDVYLYYFE